jgi:hypothetical protein
MTEGGAVVTGAAFGCRWEDGGGTQHGLWGEGHRMTGSTLLIDGGIAA